MWLGDDRSLTMPAGRVLVVLVVALGLAALLNSEAIVRAGEGMNDGPTRDVVLSVGRPLDDAAGPWACTFRARDWTSRSGRTRRQRPARSWSSGSVAILRRRQARRAAFRQPTPARPLRVLVTGDSQAEFVGQRLVDVAPPGLLRTDVVARNSTGLTRPEFFNWEVNAQQEIADREPDAVVMLMGGNDGFNVWWTTSRTGRSRRSGRPSTPAARRWSCASWASDGRRPVYWAPSPSARDPEFNRIYRVQNFAVDRAARAVPGARYVDLYTRSAAGATARSEQIDGGACSPARPTACTSRATAPSAGARWWCARWRRDFPALGPPPPRPRPQLSRRVARHGGQQRVLAALATERLGPDVALGERILRVGALDDPGALLELLVELARRTSRRIPRTRAAAEARGSAGRGRGCRASRSPGFRPRSGRRIRPGRRRSRGPRVPHVHRLLGARQGGQSGNRLGNAGSRSDG